MRRRRLLAPLLVAAALPFAVAACDELNKPMGHPQSQPRRTCFSDVECPSNLKCVKGPQDIEGQCVPRTAMDDAGTPGTGADTEGDGASPAPAPTPTITAAPGDIQI